LFYAGTWCQELDVVCQETNDKRLRFVDQLMVFLFLQNSGFAQRDPGI